MPDPVSTSAIAPGPTILPVYLRIKPKSSTSDTQSFLTVEPGGGPNSTAIVKVEPPKGGRYKADETFTFSGVYRETASQLDTYKGTVFTLVENVLLNNRDSLFFTMGASASGKTHTVLGYKQVPGMIHLSIDTIFKSVGDNLVEFEDAEAILDKNSARTSSAMEAGLFLDWSKTTGSKLHFASNSMLSDTIPVADTDGDKYRYAVYISMVEIYNDRVFSLLDDSPKRRPLVTKTDTQSKRTYLTDVQKIFVTDASEAFRVVERGLGSRKANATGINDVSSRSHAFTMIEVKKIPKDKRRSVVSSTLTIVDLAGSERNKVAKNVGARLTESCAINQSLMLLGQCLQKQRDREQAAQALAEDDDKDAKKPSTGTKPEFSIFRNCKLTQLLLSNAFIPKGNQKTLIMVNIDPYGDYNSASQILRYAALARELAIPETRVTSLSSIAASDRSVSGSSNGSGTSSRAASRSDAESLRSASSGSSSVTLFEVEGRSFSSSSDSIGTYNDAQPHDVKYLTERVRQLEQIALRATEQAMSIEQQVREEMTDVMETQLRALEEQYQDHMDDDYSKNLEVTDAKLQLLAQSIRQSERERYEGLLAQERKKWQQRYEQAA